MKKIYDEKTGMWSITEIEPCELAEIQACVLMTYLQWKGDAVEISDETLYTLCLGKEETPEGLENEEPIKKQ